MSDERFTFVRERDVQNARKNTVPKNTKDIPCGAVIVIISGRKQGTLSFKISNQKTLNFHLFQSLKIQLLMK
jgi:hypothetical protein